MMQNITNYDQIDLLVDFASSDTVESWIIYANVQYNQKIAAGVTGVIIAQMFPYLQTEQLVGLLSGILGAAEYENLVGAPCKRDAMDKCRIVCPSVDCGIGDRWQHNLLYS